MAGTLDVVRQTHRTILFEEFSRDNTDNLFTLLQADYDKEAKRLEDIKEKLEVRSFNEFLDKFSPTVYEHYETINGRPSFKYTLNPHLGKQPGWTPLSVTDHPYYTMLVKTYEEKRSREQANIDFDTTRLDEMLTPRHDVDEAIDIQNQMTQLTNKYAEAQINGDIGSLNFYKKKVMDYRRKIRDKYTLSPIPLLAAAIHNAKQDIQQIDQKLKELNSVPKDMGATPKILSGKFRFDENGRATVRVLSSGSETASGEAVNLNQIEACQKDISNKLIQVVEGDYDVYGDKEDSFQKNLIVASYAPVMSADERFSNKGIEELEEMRRNTEDCKAENEAIYAQAKQAFVDEMNDVVQKLLDVKIFFDHATVRKGANEKIQPGLLVTNCNVTKFMDGGEMQDRFTKFIARYGKPGNETKDKIWFAILPHIFMEKQAVQEFEMTDEDVFTAGNLDDAFASVDQDDPWKSRPVYFDDLKGILKLMDENGIMTIFNFSSNGSASDMTFDGISADKVETLKERLKETPYEHSVYAYPNFTLKDAKELSVDSANMGKQDRTTAKIRVPATYVDAAYVAAGLMVASQQPLFLQRHGFDGRVNANEVCVHIDLEDNEIANELVTHFNRELPHKWDEDIREAIEQERFGFVLCGDLKYQSDKEDPKKKTEIRNSYVLRARTLKKGDKYFVPIYRVLTQDFIKHYANSISLSSIDEFLDNYVQEWTEQAARPKLAHTLNLVLREGENIIRDEDDQEALLLVFNKDHMRVKGLKLKKREND